MRGGKSGALALRGGGHLRGDGFAEERRVTIAANLAGQNHEAHERRAVAVNREDLFGGGGGVHGGEWLRVGVAVVWLVRTKSWG